MPINFDAVINDVDDKPLQLRDKKEGEAEAPSTTLKDLAYQALNATFRGEEDLSREEKKKRYRLIKAIKRGEWDLSATRIVLLKTVIGKGYPPNIVGQADDLIEPGKTDEAE